MIKKMLTNYSWARLKWRSQYFLTVNVSTILEFKLHRLSLIMRPELLNVIWYKIVEIGIMSISRANFYKILNIFRCYVSVLPLPCQDVKISLHHGTKLLRAVYCDLNIDIEELPVYWRCTHTMYIVVLHPMTCWLFRGGLDSGDGAILAWYNSGK